MKKHLLLLPLIAVLFLLSVSAPHVNAQFPRTRGFFENINGATIYYTITGRYPFIRSFDNPIVLIHGYPLNGDLFEQQRRVLSLTNTVITVDLRGYGRSVAPDDQGSIDLYATDVLTLLDRLNIQQAIIGGHSMGGAVVLQMYQRAPNRFRGMILNDAAAFPPPTIEQFLWRGYQQQSSEMGAASLVPILLPEFLTGRIRNERPELVAEVTNLILAASVNGLVGGAKALETRPDFRPLFPTISVPTLILYGEEDSLTPMEQAKMLNAMIPNSELAIVRGATHGVIREDSVIANFVIESWLYRNFALGTYQAAPKEINERLLKSGK